MDGAVGCARGSFHCHSDVGAQVMRSTNRRQPCVCCGVVTAFEREVVGKRGGHVRWEPCCCECGETKREAKAA